MTIRELRAVALALAGCGATDAPSTVPAPASSVAADPTALRPFDGASPSHWQMPSLTCGRPSSDSTGPGISGVLRSVQR